MNSYAWSSGTLPLRGQSTFQLGLLSGLNRVVRHVGVMHAALPQHFCASAHAHLRPFSNVICRSGMPDAVLHDGIRSDLLLSRDELLRFCASYLGTGAKVEPGCTGCPPGLRPLVRRNDFGTGLTERRVRRRRLRRVPTVQAELTPQLAFSCSSASLAGAQRPAPARAAPASSHVKSSYDRRGGSGGTTP